MQRNPQLFKANLIDQKITILKTQGFFQSPYPVVEVQTKELTVQSNPLLKVVGLHQCNQMAVNHLEDLLQIGGVSTKRSSKSIQSHKGNLIRLSKKLAQSTKGLQLSNLKSQKMTGGIFGLIKLKKKIDETGLLGGL